MMPKRTGALVCTAVLLLASCAERPPEAHERTCSLGALEANPSGLHRSGSVGGVALADDPSVSSADRIDVATIAAGVGGVFSPRDVQHDVVLLVVDDFGALHTGGSSAFVVDPDAFELRYDQYLLDHPALDVPYPDWLVGRLQQLQAGGKLSHGAFVLSHTLELLQAAGATVVEDAGDRVVLTLGPATVVVRAVEVGGMDAGQIAEALEAVADAERMQGAERFVVNMSFTLEPCDDVRAFREEDAASFDPYLAATPPAIGPGDALYDLIQRDTRDTAFVAAAGNFGAAEPRQPGRMPEVASVSASRGTTGEVFDASNHGEVRMPGLWIPLGNPFGRHGAVMPGGVLLGGTSLAAPGVALAAMLDFAAEPSRCYDPEEGTRLAHGTYDDPGLAEAVDTHCLPGP